LCLGGSQVAKAYWRLLDTTTERFAPPTGALANVRWYRTGDLVHNTAKYGLIFHGRADRQVKIRGHRIELQEIETVIRAVSGTEMVGVVPWPVMENGLPLGLVALINAPRMTATAVLRECRKRLPDYMIPSELHELSEWPLNANGKTDYRALLSILATSSSRKSLEPLRTEFKRLQ